MVWGQFCLGRFEAGNTLRCQSCRVNYNDVFLTVMRAFCSKSALYWGHLDLTPAKRVVPGCASGAVDPVYVDGFMYFGCPVRCSTSVANSYARRLCAT